MAPDCKNSVTIFATADDMDSLKQTIQGNGEFISFESFIPSPEELIESTRSMVLSPSLVEKYGAMDISTWRLKNWGCVSDAYSSKVVDERDIDIPSMNIMKELERLPLSESTEAFKSVLIPIERTIQFTFRTNEVPTSAMMELSKKFPNALIHFGYDSVAEDVCGWANLKDGELKGHEHYDNCLETIRLHVEPFTEESGNLLDNLLNGDTDTSN